MDNKQPSATGTGMVPLAAERAQRIEDFIASLGRDELVYLQGVIVNRLKKLSQAEAKAILSTLNPGDSVFFNAGEQRLNGRVVQLNRKTVTVACADGRIWRVSAQLIYRFR